MQTGIVPHLVSLYAKNLVSLTVVSPTFVSWFAERRREALYV